VSKISLPSVAGREIVLAMLEAGEIFGEMALLDGSERTDLPPKKWTGLGR
jgi:CRP-like cAMP-binding protein